MWVQTQDKNGIHYIRGFYKRKVADKFYLFGQRDGWSGVKLGVYNSMYELDKSFERLRNYIEDESKLYIIEV